MSRLYRCRKCGLELRAFATMQRHVDEVHGHGRIELLQADDR